MSISIGTKYKDLNYSVNNNTVKNNFKTDKSQEGSLKNSENVPYYHPNGVIHFDIANKTAYIDGIKMDEKFFDIWKTWKLDSTKDTDFRLVSKINKMYNQTEADVLKRIFGV